MAHIKSQIKRNRQNEQQRLRNKAVRSQVKTAMRRFHEASHAGDPERAHELARAAARHLDKAVSRGVIHRNQAAHKKSKLATKSAAVGFRDA